MRNYVRHSLLVSLSLSLLEPRWWRREKRREVARWSRREARAMRACGNVLAVIDRPPFYALRRSIMSRVLPPFGFPSFSALPLFRPRPLASSARSVSLPQPPATCIIHPRPGSLSHPQTAGVLISCWWTIHAAWITITPTLFKNVITIFFCSLSHSLRLAFSFGKYNSGSSLP